jgi:hypothetical protein
MQNSTFSPLYLIKAKMEVYVYLYVFIYIYIGHFMMFSAITNIYNKKPKGAVLMEVFTVTGRLKKFFFKLEIFDVCTMGDKQAHNDTIFKFLPHTQ